MLFLQQHPQPSIRGSLLSNCWDSLAHASPLDPGSLGAGAARQKVPWRKSKQKPGFLSAAASVWALGMQAALGGPGHLLVGGRRGVMEEKEEERAESGSQHSPVVHREGGKDVDCSPGSVTWQLCDLGQVTPPL